MATASEALRVRSLAPETPTYMVNVYAAFAAFWAICGAVLVLINGWRGDILAALVAALATGTLAVLAWSVSSGKTWGFRLADALHVAALVGGGVVLARWLAYVLGLIATDDKIIAGGRTLNVILAQLGHLPINTLGLADALVIFSIAGLMVFLLRHIRAAQSERLQDANHVDDLEQGIRRFLKSFSARVGGTLVVLLLLVTYLMPRLDPYDLTVAMADGDLALRLSPPDCVIGWIRAQQGLDQPSGSGITCNHPFGTDKNGRDLTRRVLHGISVSLAVSVLSVTISLLIGASIGLFAGYLGGKLDSLLMRLMDIMLAFPTLLLAIAIVAMRGPGLDNAMIAIGIVGIPTYARLARAMAISLREQEFVTAARSVGVSQRRILSGHVLPNSLAPLIVQSTLGLGTAVIETAALGFLGLGQQPPFPELGKMLAESREVLTSGMWWMIVFPGVTVVLMVLSFNLLGDALRDTLDPRLRGN